MISASSRLRVFGRAIARPSIEGTGSLPAPAAGWTRLAGQLPGPPLKGQYRGCDAVGVNVFGRAIARPSIEGGTSRTPELPGRSGLAGQLPGPPLKA